ncbi:M48 family metallopeptidase [Eikenella sp. S3360]|uniref:M48 family metallopeptidase n=1 Tax=Eikenella glucosivorans TaxID=2766967 RepID=A0ABS0NDI0_9NEIS|nr:SprT family zinc-dependent metalloprotease [Eikenella glucosivorans]MBH5330320.1 M48 family metallopeptidase [Eikenella glucosivorans]
MPLLPHTLANGQTIQLHLSRRAKKNIILRAHSASSLRLSIPPQLSLPELRRWLQHNEAALQQMLARAPAPAAPGCIWLHGRPHQLGSHTQPTIQIQPGRILLPPAEWPQQQAQLRRHLLPLAEAYLLPRLAAHAERLQLIPEHSALSRAKSFWGVCHRRSIRLNWRLVGAPAYVADYVGVHELCHLRHPNHSPAFWALVEQHTPHRSAASAWLKQHGRELFVL